MNGKTFAHLPSSFIISNVFLIIIIIIITILLNYRFDFYQISRLKMHHTTRSQGRSYSTFICNVFTLFALLSIDCWAAVIKWRFVRSFTDIRYKSGISLFIIRHSIISNKWVLCCILKKVFAGCVNKQLKSDAERPSSININELHRIHQKCAQYQFVHHQTKVFSKAIRYVCIDYSFWYFVLPNEFINERKSSTFTVIEYAHTSWHLFCLTLYWGYINDSNVCYHSAEVYQSGIW